jgi:hypothetical protein
MTKTCVMAAAVALLALSARPAVAEEVEPPSVDPPITARVIEGGGAWKTDGESPKASQRWELDVTRGDDNSLSGQVTLHDSPLLTTGKVQGRILGGRTVTGRVLNEAGEAVVSFQGRIGTEEMSGTYTDSTGETGEWVWEGVPPQ